MSDFRRLQNQQMLREAEGYLDLLTLDPAKRAALRPEVRDRVATRALRLLSLLEHHQGRNAHVCFLQGQALKIMERYREAIVPLAQAAELDPDNFHIWLALGWCHKRTNRIDLAIQSLEEALCSYHNEAIIYYNLACYWSLAYHLEQALEYLAVAFEIDPEFRELAATEPDFDHIRLHPDFQALTSVIV